MKRYVHSALAGNYVSNAAPCERLEMPSGVAFRFDITEGFLPSDYAACDAIFAMMPWRAGYDEFNRRANITEKRDWPRFVDAVSGIITNTSASIVLMWGKHVEAYLPPYDWQMPTKDDLIFYGWRLPSPPASAPLTRAQMLMGLCANYSCIGDFCCGYGETGYYATLAQKHYVLSDCNPQCIGDIAENHGGWGAK